MSTINRIGLVLLGLLSLADLAMPLLTDGETPPMAVAVGASALGLVSLVLIVLSWRGRSWALVPLLVLRLASAGLAVPAFFVDDVPAAAFAAASITVGLTVAGVVALLVRPRSIAQVR